MATANPPPENQWHAFLIEALTCAVNTGVLTHSKFFSAFPPEEVVDCLHSSQNPELLTKLLIVAGVNEVIAPDMSVALRKEYLALAVKKQVLQSGMVLKVLGPALLLRLFGDMHTWNAISAKELRYTDAAGRQYTNQLVLLAVNGHYVGEKDFAEGIQLVKKISTNPELAETVLNTVLQTAENGLPFAHKQLLETVSLTDILEQTQVSALWERVLEPLADHLSSSWLPSVETVPAAQAAAPEPGMPPRISDSQPPPSSPEDWDEESLSGGFFGTASRVGQK